MKITNMLKLGITLAAFATAACVMLAFVYKATETRRNDNLNKIQEESLKEIFENMNIFRELTKEDDVYLPMEKKLIIPDDTDGAVTIEKIFNVWENGEKKAAFIVSRAGYSGPIRTMVGISSGGFIIGIRIMEISDTPGLGANANSPNYYVDRKNRITFFGQFAGKSIKDPFIVKNDIDAITASTITSQAVSSSVKAAALISGENKWLFTEEEL